MRYSASWRNTSGWGVICLLLSAAFLGAGAALWEPGLVVISATLSAYLAIIGLRLSAFIDSRHFEYRSFFTSHDVEWNQIVSVIRTKDFGYPRNRFYMESSYEIRTSGSRFIVNLLYFGPDFSKVFLDEVKSRGLMRHPRP